MPAAAAKRKANGGLPFSLKKAIKRSINFCEISGTETSSPTATAIKTSKKTTVFFRLLKSFKILIVVPFFSIWYNCTILCEIFPIHNKKNSLCKKLKSPEKIQDFLDAIPINFETGGET